MQRVRVNLRKTNPLLYHLSLICGVGNVAFAVNYWTAHPTFNPYHIHKGWVAVAFLLVGVAQLVFLNVRRDFRNLKRAQAVGATVAIFWGFGNTQQFFAGNASLALCIAFWTIAAVQLALMFGSPINPLTEKLE